MFILVPSGPPRNITVWAVSSTSIQISWLPPPEEDQNGRIIGYKLLLNSISDPDTTLSIQTQNLTQLALIPGKARAMATYMHMHAVVVKIIGETIALFSDLEEYHEYSVAVSALTDPGPGPFSPLQSVTTLEDGKLIYFHTILSH